MWEWRSPQARTWCWLVPGRDGMLPWALGLKGGRATGDCWRSSETIRQGWGVFFYMAEAVKYLVSPSVLLYCHVFLVVWKRVAVVRLHFSFVLQYYSSSFYLVHLQYWWGVFTLSIYSIGEVYCCVFSNNKGKIINLPLFSAFTPLNALR